MPDGAITAILTTHTDDRWPYLERAAESLQGTGVDVLGVFEDARLASRFDETYGAGVFWEPIDGLADARNIGADLANGAYYAFLDDDVRVSDRWAAAMRDAFDSGASAVGGPAWPDWPDGIGRPRWLAREFDWLVGCGPYYDGERVVRNTYGCNFAVRADAFHAVGGFDTSLGKRGDLRQGEDAMLGRALRQRYGEGMVYRPAMSVRHTVFAEQTRLAHLLRRAYWQGRSKALMGLDDEETGFLADVLGGLREQRLFEAVGSLAFVGATGVGYVQGRLTG